MAQWLWSHRMIFILIIVLDALVLNYLEKKHRKDDRREGQRAALGLDYFWGLMKQGRRDGVIAIAMTALALLSALLAGAAYLLAEAPDSGAPGR